MPSLPPRANRVLQAVDMLKDEIMSGSLKGGLPGERELARRLRVSRITLKGALEILEKEKWLTPSEPRKRRRILKKAKGGVSDAHGCRGKTVVTLAPLDLFEMPSTVRLQHSKIGAYLSGSGVSFKHRTLDVTHLKRPGHRLQEFVMQNPADLYLLLLATKEVQQWFSETNTPCIVLGSAWPQFGLSSSDWDQRALGFHLGSMLTRRGHHQIGIIFPDPPKYGMELFLEGLKGSSPDLNIQLSPQDFDPDSIKKGLVSLLQDPSSRPTVILLPRVFYVMAAVTVLPSLGVRIPEDVSLLCLVYDDSFQFFHPSVAGYQVDTGEQAKVVSNLVVEKLRHPNTQFVKNALIMPDFVPGASFAESKKV